MKSLYAKTFRQWEIQLILRNNLFFFLKIILKIQHIKLLPFFSIRRGLHLQYFLFKLHCVLASVAVAYFNQLGQDFYPTKSETFAPNIYFISF